MAHCLYRPYSVAVGRPAALIVQVRLAETFQRSGSFAGVGNPGEGLAIDYQVIVEIRSFEVRVDGGDHAEVELFVRILNDRKGEVLASTCFTASAPVSGGGNQAYVSALVSAAHSLDLWNVERRIDPPAKCSLQLRPCKIRLRPSFETMASNPGLPPPTRSTPPSAPETTATSNQPDD
ncbi:membrane integrity-associated transporter subunit PqiC [Mesorhizobium sp. AR07]|nr:membrane integrity-associated transporter subunit PqiC [Mesorhizobium sp. AR07]